MNLASQLPSDEFDDFHHELTQNMNEILPIIAYHLKRNDMASGKTQNLLFFVLSTVSWCHNSTKYDHSSYVIYLLTFLHVFVCIYSLCLCPCQQFVV